MKVGETNELVEVIEEIARSRGIANIEELVERVNAAGGEVSLEELRGDFGAGFGVRIDKVLHTNEEERRRITQAFSNTFLGAGD